MKEIRTEIDIAAPPEVVWGILIDFPAYGEWNPFIVRMWGEAALGARVLLVAALGPGKGVPAAILARLVCFDKPRRFAWGGPGIDVVKKLFGAEHYFELESMPDGGCHLVQGERFLGALPHLAWPFLQRTRPAYEALNLALKRRAEARVR